MLLHSLNAIPFVPAADGRNIAVLLSGGVDSSTTAWLLQQNGWTVAAVHMRIPLACGNALDDSAAVAAAAHLKVPLYQLDLTTAFHTEIIDRFQRAYRHARTPNPCVDCNRRLKFGQVWDVIRTELGIEHLATGHYAVTATGDNGQTVLRAAVESGKDQSYFVYGIPTERLPFLHFPLGTMGKNATREIARTAGLSSAEKADSMELCFAGGGDYRTALPADIPNIPGDFVDIHGKKIGTHSGVANYTLGQRKLGVSLGAAPHYVIRIFPEENRIVVGSAADAKATTVSADLLVIHQPEKLILGAEFLGKIRSGPHATPCTVSAFSTDSAAHDTTAGRDDGPFCGKLTVEFSRPLFAPTPGQHLVIYDAGMAVVAGGVIN